MECLSHRDDLLCKTPCVRAGYGTKSRPSHEQPRHRDKKEEHTAGNPGLKEKKEERNKRKRNKEEVEDLKQKKRSKHRESAKHNEEHERQISQGVEKSEHVRRRRSKSRKETETDRQPSRKKHDKHNKTRQRDENESQNAHVQNKTKTERIRQENDKQPYQNDRVINKSGRNSRVDKETKNDIEINKSGRISKVHKKTKKDRVINKSGKSSSKVDRETDTKRRVSNHEKKKHRGEIPQDKDPARYQDHVKRIKSGRIRKDFHQRKRKPLKDTESDNSTDPETELKKRQEEVRKRLDKRLYNKSSGKISGATELALLQDSARDLEKQGRSFETFDRNSLYEIKDGELHIYDEEKKKARLVEMKEMDTPYKVVLIPGDNPGVKWVTTFGLLTTTLLFFATWGSAVFYILTPENGHSSNSTLEMAANWFSG